MCYLWTKQKTQLPHLNVVGRTNKYSTFPVTFGLLSGKTKKIFGWALNEQLTNLGIGQDIRVILTDRELALMKALKDEMPYAYNMICIWHIKTIKG